MNINDYLDYIQLEQVAAAAYEYPRPYNILRTYYNSCARSCARFEGDRPQRNICILNCKIAVTKRELLLTKQQLLQCGRVGNLRCQDQAKKKMIRVNKKLQANLSAMQRYRANLK